jgi:precorrin-8X/cobalt-precorrin-8 methylmutase
MQPHEIESLSFQIIEAEAGAHGFPVEQWPVVRRMIHTSADFDYLRSVRFYPGAVQAGIAAVNRGAALFCDTQMVRSGLRKADLAKFGVEAACLIGEAGVAQDAKARGVTRAHAAVDAVADRLEGAIYVVGNAPTALLRLIERVRQDKLQPALIVGLPVGFVNAAESKAELLTLEIPHITNVGRKGGSNVAASVMNALVLMAGENS